MSLFKKKKKIGQNSSIKELRSPYLKKLSIPKKIKKVKRLPTIAPPSKLRNTTHPGKKLLALLLTIGISLFCLYAVFLSDYFLIEDFSVEEEGTIISDNTVIHDILRKQLGTNLILLNSEELSVQIKSSRPEINELSVQKIWPKKLKISFKKYPTVANIVNIINGVQKKYLVDSQGFLTEENNENINLPYIRLETSEPLKLRTTFLADQKRSIQRLDYMIKAIHLFEEKFNIKIRYAKLYQREREVHLYTEKNFYVMIDIEKDLNRQIDKLKKALSKLDIYNESLVYIDLRISGTNNEKIIFKRN